MAVFTFINKSEMTQFLNQYDVGELIDMDGIKEGIQNTNYRILTTKGRYIVTLYENYNLPEDVPFFASIMMHLHRHNFPCPVPLATHDNEISCIFKDKPTTIVSFIEGIQTNEQNIDASACFCAGKTMASMHTYLNDFEKKRDNTLSIHQLTQWYDKWIENAKTTSYLQKDIYYILKSIQNSWPSHSSMCPLGVIHADFFPDNVFFNNNDISGVIDFNFSCNDFLAYDLAIAINAWCFNDNGDVLNKVLSKSLIEGYETIRPLNEKEKEFFPIFCRGGAMRFLLSRLYDFETTPQDAFISCKDPKQFLNRLYSHLNLDNFTHYY